MQNNIREENINSMRYDANKKSLLIAYLLWFFFGYLGGHRFYLGRVGSGIILAVLSIVCFVISVGTLGLGAVTFIVPGVWLLVDLFLVYSITNEHNNSLINSFSSKSSSRGSPSPVSSQNRKTVSSPKMEAEPHGTWHHKGYEIKKDGGKLIIVGVDTNSENFRFVNDAKQYIDAHLPDVTPLEKAPATPVSQNTENIESTKSSAAGVEKININGVEFNSIESAKEYLDGLNLNSSPETGGAENTGILRAKK